MQEKYERPLKDVFNSTVLESEGCFQNLKKKYSISAKSDRNVTTLAILSARKTINEIRKAVDEVFGEDPRGARTVVIYVRHRYSDERLKEIGACFNVGEFAVSQTSSRFLIELEKIKQLGGKCD